MNKAQIILFILVFWIIVYAGFGLVGESLVVPTEIGNIDKASGLDLLFGVMFFSLPPGYEIPMIVSLILDIVAIMSVYVIAVNVAGLLRGYDID